MELAFDLKSDNSYDRLIKGTTPYWQSIQPVEKRSACFGYGAETRRWCNFIHFFDILLIYVSTGN